MIKFIQYLAPVLEEDICVRVKFCDIWLGVGL